ncbi:MAG: hypothetical protein HND50_04520 [Calditrichaeota bacterium]|nr:hypothetical protein [Calditrichota bacterium]
MAKYLRYALGEILLVVIGILIALQINNWNEQRKINKAEQTILNDLKIEIASNIKSLKALTTEHRNSLDSAQKLRQLFNDKSQLTKISNNTIMNYVWALKGKNYYMEKGILNSILSSGQINAIQNKKLKYLLASLIDVTEEKMAVTNYVRNMGNEILLKSVYPKAIALNMSEGKGKNDARNLFNVPEFWLVVRGTFIENRQIALKNEEELKRIYEQVLNLIKGENI